ncbi:MAG: transporter [Sphingomonadaceae bacterium]|nr:transporter [Sphingomonadaceae bacterium]
MRRIVEAALALAPLLLAAAPARAETLRDLCPDRPGLGTPACTMDPGHVQIELGLGDWTLTRDPGAREDDLTTGDLLVRYGLTPSLEMQVGWTAYTHVRTRAGGVVAHQSGIGDVRLALRQNLHNPDGSGFSAALMPYVSLPTGSDGIGAGDWGAGLIVPVSDRLSQKVTLDFTGEADAAVDADGNGRHFAYSAVFGVDVALSDKVGTTWELSVARDEDPSGHSTQLLAGLSADWTPGSNTQLDVGTNVGLNRNVPDVEVYFGVAQRF